MALLGPFSILNDSSFPVCVTSRDGHFQKNNNKITLLDYHYYIITKHILYDINQIACPNIKVILQLTFAQKDTNAHMNLNMMLSSLNNNTETPAIKVQRIYNILFQQCSHTNIMYMADWYCTSCTCILMTKVIPGITAHF